MRKIMTLIVVILGITTTAGVVANALDKKEPTKFTVTAWYVIDSSDQNNPKVMGSPIAPPPASDENGCAQENPPTDKLCAVELNVPSSSHSFTTPTGLDALPSGITQTGNEARSREE